MKMISEHLGRIIATLAAIAVVIGVITCYRADLGEFFMNVISGEQRIADGVLGNMGDFDLNGDYSGPEVAIDQALGSSSDNPLGVETSSFTLSGTVTDKSGITSLTVNGNNVTVADDGTWSTPLTLTKNVTTEVCVVATDSEGNTTEKTGYVGYISYTNAYVGKNAFAEEIGYSDTVTDLVIPATFKRDGTWYKVVGFNQMAFQNCTNLTTVTIPNGVTYIGTCAFENCTGLEKVDIPDTVTTILTSAFRNCKALKNITIPEGVTIIEGSVFSDCINLERADIPNTVTKINYSAFAYCRKLNNVIIPEDVTSIGSHAFMGCTSLTSVIIPDSVTTIGDAAFSSCSNLTSVTISDSVTSIGNSAFYGCLDLINVTIPNNVTSIGQKAFAQTGLTNVSFENTENWYVTTILGATSGDTVDVTNASTNVTNLRSTYRNYYWYRSVSE